MISTRIQTNQRYSSNQSIFHLANSDSKFQALYIFGRNVAEIPCFRNSFIYGAVSI